MEDRSTYKINDLQMTSKCPTMQLIAYMCNLFMYWMCVDMNVVYVCMCPWGGGGGGYVHGRCCVGISLLNSAYNRSLYVCIGDVE